MKRNLITCPTCVPAIRCKYAPANPIKSILIEITPLTTSGFTLLSGLDGYAAPMKDMFNKMQHVYRREAVKKYPKISYK